MAVPVQMDGRKSHEQISMMSWTGKSRARQTLTASSTRVPLDNYFKQAEALGNAADFFLPRCHALHPGHPQQLISGRATRPTVDDINPALPMIRNIP